MFSDRHSGAFDRAVDKVVQTSLLLVATKLVASWIIVAVTGVGLQSRLLYGVVPFAGLETNATRFREVAGWSTLAVAVAAVLWTGWHFARLRRTDPAKTWAAAASMPMAALLAFFEWMRRFNADHLLPTEMLVQILLPLTIASVLFAGFTDLPWTVAAGHPAKETAVSNRVRQPLIERPLSAS